MMSPYSPKSPRIWLPWAVRALMNPWRTRCIASNACCATFFTATKRMLGVVPETLQLPRPVMSASAGFHAHQTRLELREERRHLVALELLAHDHFAAPVYRVNLEHILCQVEPHRRNLHVGRPSRLSGWISTSTLAHRRRCERGRPSH